MLAHCVHVRIEAWMRRREMECNGNGNGNCKEQGEMLQLRELHQHYLMRVSAAWQFTLSHKSFQFFAVFSLFFAYLSRCFWISLFCLFLLHSVSLCFSLLISLSSLLSFRLSLTPFLSSLSSLLLPFIFLSPPKNIHRHHLLSHSHSSFTATNPQSKETESARTHNMHWSMHDVTVRPVH